MKPGCQGTEEKPIRPERMLPPYVAGKRLAPCPKCGSVGLHGLKYGMTDVGADYLYVHRVKYVPSLSIFCHACEVPLGAYAPLDYVP